MPKRGSKSPQCIVPNCGSTELYARGMCTACYKASWHLVNHGKTTWKKLEDKGLARPANPGPPLTNPAAIAILGHGKGK